MLSRRMLGGRLLAAAAAAGTWPPRCGAAVAPRRALAQSLSTSPPGLAPEESRLRGAAAKDSNEGAYPQHAQQRSLSMSALRQPDPAELYVPAPPPPPSLGLSLNGASAATTAPTPAAGGGGKVVPFLLADIGEGIAEVEMMQWFVREGDSVKQFDRLCEVQSDKATVEISSRYDGVVKRVHHEVGAVVKVGSPLVDIELPGDEAAAAPTMNNAGPPPAPTASAAPAPMPSAEAPSLPTTQQAGAAASAPAASASTEIVPTTPAVRRLAKEYGVDLSRVSPTGPQGRVLKGDVIEYIRIRGGGTPVIPTPMPASPLAAAPLAAAPALNGAAPAPAAASLPHPLAPAPAPAVLAPLPPLPPSPLSAAVLTEEKRVPVRGVMRQMVKSMTASLAIPHFGYQDEVLMDKAAALRESLKPLAEAQGIRLSYLPIMLKAASLALLQYPILNASLSADGAEVVYHPDHNIGVAMDTPKGLVVPVLKRVQEKSLFQIARELTELQALAATGAFTEEHFAGATFSLSNIGSIGGTYMDAKIVPPQVAIGAVGKIQTLPRFGGPDGQAVVAARVMAISWAGDHRVIDGATMARFSNLWKAYLEEPAAMLAETK